MLVVLGGLKMAYWKRKDYTLVELVRMAWPKKCAGCTKAQVIVDGIDGYLEVCDDSGPWRPIVLSAHDDAGEAIWAALRALATAPGTAEHEVQRLHARLAEVWSHALQVQESLRLGDPGEALHDIGHLMYALRSEGVRPSTASALS
jgi:hypothetical protein